MELGVANLVTTLFIIEKYNLGVLFQMLFCSNTTFEQIIGNEETISPTLKNFLNALNQFTFKPKYLIT